MMIMMMMMMIWLIIVTIIYNLKVTPFFQRLHMAKNVGTRLVSAYYVIHHLHQLSGEHNVSEYQFTEH